MSIDYFACRKAFARALEGGAKRLSLSHAEWDVSGGCRDPVYQDLHAHPPTRSGIVGVDHKTRTPFRLELWVRCRRCDNCLAQRQREWTAKAIFECRNSIRTWFGTLTLRPERHYHCYAEACRRYAASGDFDALGYDAQFARRCSIIGEEITRYMKRVRKESKSSLRNLFVAEHHKSGLPHYHCLIHERDLQGTNEESLRRQWSYGFTKWKLITDARQAAYVCKYLSKSKAARIRGSIAYGKASLDIGLAFGQTVKANDPPNLSCVKESEGERHESIGWTRSTASSEGSGMPESIL